MLFSLLLSLGLLTPLQDESPKKAPHPVDEDLASFQVQLRADVPKMLKQSRTPGVGIGILRRGKTAWTGGFGLADIESERPITDETIFNIGSISKTIAAWGLMKLVQENELDLDEPVVDLLTLWSLPESQFDRRGVTLRRLLSHTAGLSLHGYPGFGLDELLPSLEESLSGDTNGSGDVHLISEPGTQWKYSGGGYTMAQLLLEEATDGIFASWMRENVFKPLGMHSSDYDWSDMVKERAATPYDQRLRKTEGPTFTAQAAASLQTTVKDLARFAEASLPGYHEGDGPVLSDETILSMQQPQENSPNYGLGYQVQSREGLTVVGHSGANRGWMARLSLVPETGDGLIVLTNGSNGGNVHSQVFNQWIRWVSSP